MSGRLDPYATVAEYSATKGKVTTADDTAILRDLTAVSRFIDRVCGRRAGFGKDASDVVRTFQSFGAYTLDIDDLVSVTLVEELIGTTWTTVATSDYSLKPYTAAIEAEPYRQIERSSTIWPARQIPNGPRVRITGKWGWPAVPEAVKTACIELTAILRVESPRATGRIQDGNLPPLMVSRAARDVVERLLERFVNPAVYV